MSVVGLSYPVVENISSVAALRAPSGKLRVRAKWGGLVTRSNTMVIVARWTKALWFAVGASARRSCSGHILDSRRSSFSLLCC